MSEELIPFSKWCQRRQAGYLVVGFIGWCLFTLVTGEYGDFYPASTEGRVVTVLLMTAGVAVFGTFTASVASFFLEEDQQEDEKRETAMMAEVGSLRLEIQELKLLLEGDGNNGSNP